MTYACAILFTLFLWWFSTGVVIYLDLLPVRTFRWSMAGGSLLAVASLYGLWVTRNDLSGAGAYLAFSFALTLWAWQLLGFYMGFIAGPRRQARVVPARGWTHFWDGVQTCLYHELAVIAGALVLLVVTMDGSNPVGLWTYLILWAMHVSAKLNVFLGVRNLNAHFLPDHLAYLKSFLKVKPMNALFPLSVTAATIVTVLLVQRALAADATSFEVVAYTLLATLAALGVLEHWFLVLPLPAEALWEWSLKAKRVFARSEPPRKLPVEPALAARD